MKRIIQYIFLALMGVLASCQRPELIEQLPTVEIEGGEARRVPIVFTASIPGMEPTTKAMDHEPDITSFHLIVFDEKGMYVETAAAEVVDSTFKDIHEKNYHRKFKVTLTLSEEPRIIHFIANCPVDQIIYGHEASVIGNLFVENGATAYWSRAKVDHIRVFEFPNVTTPGDQNNSNGQDDSSDQTPEGGDVATFGDDVTTGDDTTSGDGTTSDDGTHFHPCKCLKEHLEHVHLLRNFAEIVVEDKTDLVAETNNTTDKFTLKGFTVYNTIAKGTVAPYNNNKQAFQCFVDESKATASEGETIDEIYDYDDLIAAPHYYEGHALGSADLIGIPEDPADIVWYGHDKHFFMYERKVSVRTNEEDKWRESPPHVIVKADYDGEECYYKFDLIYILETKEKDAQGNEVVVDREVKYYNILRNFLYRFEITSVDSPGYKTIAEAVAGPSSNNFAGSSTTSKFEEVNVGGASIAVSYTDTTLVDGGADHKIRFKYLFKSTNANDEAIFDYDVDPENKSENILITDVNKISTGDDGTWQEFEFTVKEPGKTTLEQTIEVRTSNHNLSRKVRLVLRQKFKMLVGCKPRIFKGIDQAQTVEIKLPPGLTEDMFPLDLAIETRGLTLYPDVTENAKIGVSLPVQTGISIIPDKLNKNQRSYYYTYRIDTYNDYQYNLPKDENNYRIVNTNWLTNTSDNASTVYVANKYFETVDSTWTNVSYAFTDVAITPQRISKGVGVPVSITFKRDSKDSSSPVVTIKLKGLKDASGNTTLTRDVSSNTTITVSDLVTTDPEGLVGFTLDNANYMLASAEVTERFTNSFNGSFDKNSVDAGVDKDVNYSFYIPTYFAGMTVDVTFDGLKPKSEISGLEYVETVGSVRRYRFTPSADHNSSTAYVFPLVTTNNEASICKVSLKTDDKYYYTPVTSTLNQAMKEFRSLTIPNVKQGVGRPVNISFQLAEGESEAKNINVSLVGMTRNGEPSFTINTGNNGDVTVSNNGTYTIRNVVTSTLDGDLKVTIAASDYSAKTAERTNRQRAQFSTFSVSPTSVGPNANEEVTLTFGSDDLIDGMEVTLLLDGLAPKDDLPTKAVTRYVYTVNGTGTQTITLVTTGSTTTSKTCTIQLKAEGFEDSAVKTVTQSAATYALKMSNATSQNQIYNSQVCYLLDQPLATNTTYTFKCHVRATSNINSLSIYLQQEPANEQKYDPQMQNITTQWKEITTTITTDGKQYNVITFNIGQFVGDIYMDNVSLKRNGNNTELMENNDFESGNCDGWFKKGNATFECVPEGYKP